MYLFTKFFIIFTGSDAAERMAKLLNDVFDILNGRRMEESISNMNWKAHVTKAGKSKRGIKAVLEDMLAVIDQAEACHLDPDGRQRMA